MEINKEKDIFDTIMSVDDNTKKDKTDLDVLNELFSGKDIETRTELSVQQVILINQKRTIAKLLDWDFLDNTLDDFMMLLVSKDRKGRAEFVDGFKANRENEINKNSGFIGNLKDKFLK